MSPRVRAILCVLISSSACASSPAPSVAPTAGDAKVEASAEVTSAAPGINDRYFEDGAVERWTDTLERERREVIALRDPIVAALGLEAGMVVADIGAGTGAFMSALSLGVGAEGTIYAVDIVPAFLDHLQARAQTEGLTNVEIVEATPTEVGLSEGAVDLMFMCDVYHHIEYPSVYVRSLYRALRPGGRLIIVEFDRIPGKTSEKMMKHVRQDQATLVAEVTAEGFSLEREIEDLPFDENYMLVFRK